MKNLFKRLPKKLIASVALFAVTLVGMSAVGMALLGGGRPVKQYQGPGTPGFDHVTFNSFTNVPNVGDERNFFHGKIAGAPDGFYDPMNGVRGGDEILMRVYVHNGADPKHNASGQGVAKNTRVRVELPSGLNQAQTARAFVSADNAQPQVIEDTLSMTGEYPVQLQYVSGSATIKTNFIDQKISDEVVNGGVLVGDDNVNGTMKGCFEYVALVTFKVKVVAPSYQLEKKVRLNGTPTFTKEVSAKPGQKVDYVLAFKNVGSTDLRNVVLGDKLPEGVTYVPNTTEWNSGHTNSKWEKSASNNITVGGIDVGAYAPNGAAYVRFTAQMPTEDKLKCGVNRLVNTGYAKPKDHGTIQDTATVIIEKECKPQDKPTYECKLITVEQLGGRKVRVNVTPAFTGNVKVKNFEYNFGDGSQPLVTDKNPVEYEYTKDGTYKIVVKINFTVNGQAKDGVTSSTCESLVTYTSGKPVPPTPTPTTPNELPRTGAGDVAGLIAAVTVAGAVSHRLVLARRNG
jgi:uncharacterized repeat protein (TIGR01451 family)